MDPYLVHQTRSAAAATHAIVIGVGDYPHLLNGSGTLSDYNDGMGQLTSPPLSARAVAEWLISSYNNPDKPLDSVALLLSESNPTDFVNPRTGIRVMPERANYSKVAQAIKDWAKRGAENANNLLIFYYCGHGVAQGTDMSLLLSEYGDDPDAPFAEALDFGKLRLAMSRKLPGQQIYFIDACRSSSDTLIESCSAGGVPIQVGKGASAETPVFFATLSGKEAFGKTGEVSFFTKALLKGLKGTGSDKFEREWVVTTTRLKQAIDYDVNQAFEAGAKRRQVPQTDALGTFVIHQLTSAPEVPVIVTCHPDTHNQDAEFTCVFKGIEKDRRTPVHGYWNLTLPAGNYEFRAALPTGVHEPDEQPVAVRPIFTKVFIDI